MTYRNVKVDISLGVFSGSTQIRLHFLTWVIKNFNNNNKKSGCFTPPLIISRLKDLAYVCEPGGLKNPHHRTSQSHAARSHAPAGERGQAFSVKWVVLWRGCWVTLDKFTNKVKSSHPETREVKVREDEEDDFSLKSRTRECPIIPCIWAEFFHTLFVLLVSHSVCPFRCSYLLLTSIQSLSNSYLCL